MQFKLRRQHMPRGRDSNIEAIPAKDKVKKVHRTGHGPQGGPLGTSHHGLIEAKHNIQEHIEPTRDQNEGVITARRKTTQQPPIMQCKTQAKPMDNTKCNTVIYGHTKRRQKEIARHMGQFSNNGNMNGLPVNTNRGSCNRGNRRKPDD
uniref:Uncharacterized protein n=1 Tax=Opuntia streptacantha TaxID=393608 RepID=A0A7C9D593_OPUST